MSRRKIPTLWRQSPLRRRSYAGAKRGPLRALLTDPRGYLSLAMLVAILGLLVLPLGGDALTGLLRPNTSADSCRVVGVVDGDTVSIWCPAKGVERARIMGLDTPEVFSPQCPSEWVAGTRATWALRTALWKADRVVVVKRGLDKYRRALIEMRLDGRDIADIMIKGGHARAYGGERRKGWCA